MGLPSSAIGQAQLMGFGMADNGSMNGLSYMPAHKFDENAEHRFGCHIHLSTRLRSVHRTLLNDQKKTRWTNQNKIGF